MHSNSVSAVVEAAGMDFSSRDPYFEGACSLKSPGRRNANSALWRIFSSGSGFILSRFLSHCRSRVFGEFFDVSDEVRVVDEHSAGRRTGAYNLIRSDIRQVAINRGLRPPRDVGCLGYANAMFGKVCRRHLTPANTTPNQHTTSFERVHAKYLVFTLYMLKTAIWCTSRTSSGA